MITTNMYAPLLSLGNVTDQYEHCKSPFELLDSYIGINRTKMTSSSHDMMKHFFCRSFLILCHNNNDAIK